MDHHPGFGQDCSLAQSYKYFFLSGLSSGPGFESTVGTRLPEGTGQTPFGGAGSAEAAATSRYVISVNV